MHGGVSSNVNFKYNYIDVFSQYSSGSCRLSPCNVTVISDVRPRSPYSEEDTWAQRRDADTANTKKKKKKKKNMFMMCGFSDVVDSSSPQPRETESARTKETVELERTHSESHELPVSDVDSDCLLCLLQDKHPEIIGEGEAIESGRRSRSSNARVKFAQDMDDQGDHRYMPRT